MKKRFNFNLHTKFAHPKFIHTWIVIVVMRIVVFIPLQGQILLSKPLGFLLRKVGKKKYNIAKINIHKCFPELSKKQQIKLINQHFNDFALSLFEVANCFYMSSRRLKKYYQLANLDVLQTSIKNGENIMLIVGHFTTMIIAGRILADNIHFADIYRPQNNELFNATMIKRFQKYGIKMLRVKDSKNIIKTLKSGTPIWYAPDQDLGAVRCVFVDFFNIPTCTITATSKLARSSNATLIHFNFYRQKNKYFGNFIKFKDYPSNDVDDAREINASLEMQILQAPSQYLWTHRRFKTRPNGEKSFY